MATIYYFRRLHTTYGGYILLSTVIYYFRRLYTTFDGYILLLPLPDCDFLRIQEMFAIFCIYGLKARLEFNMATIYYFRRLHTTYGGYILLSTVIYYFRRLYTTCSFTWLLFYKNPRNFCNFLHLWIKS